MERGGETGSMERPGASGRAVRITCVVSALFLLLFCACARVKFYSDPNLKTRSALPLHNSKPYLLVLPNGAKVLSASLIFLPDLAHPIYFKARSGLGNSKVEFTLKDGMLASWGQTLNSAIPETMESLASLLGAAGDVLPKSLPGEEEKPGFTLYEIYMDETGTHLVAVEIQPCQQKM
jgi:hypothetical protein